MNITHKLKIKENYLRNLSYRKKKCEIRFNDRDYQMGDFLEFSVIENDEPLYFIYRITHIHSGLGMQDGYVCLSLERVNET